MKLDYDQLLAKQPHKSDAVFAWHQDMAYWPARDIRTATFWLAVDDSTIENGCMRFVPATDPRGAPAAACPVYGGRGESHALGTELRRDDVVVTVPIARGDCTVHNERVMHGSGGNETDGFRRAYIVAYRSEPTRPDRARARLHPQPQRRPRFSTTSALPARHVRSDLDQLVPGNSAVTSATRSSKLSIPPSATLSASGSS